MAISFQTDEHGRSPGWLRRKWGALFDGVIRWIADATQEGARQAIKARFPLYAPSDALPYLGRERMTERGELEPESTYRVRLDETWERATIWGTSAGIVAEIEAWFLAAGMTNVVVYSQNDQWAGDGNTTNWSRLWVVIGQPNTWAEWEFGPGEEFGPQVLFGTDMSVDHRNTIRRLFHRHRPGHVLAAEIVVLQDGTTEIPADIAADPTLRFVAPNVSLAAGQFFNGPGFFTFGPNVVFGYYPPVT